jgi:hypothetical protein
MASVVVESAVGYQSSSVEFLTSCRDPAMGQWQSGSLTGAVAS